MGIIDRIANIAKANVNSLIDRAEDPVKVANQIIRELQGAITDARNETVSMIAQQKLLKSDLERAQADVAKNYALAERALLNGREDLAREALVRKSMADDEYQQIHKQYELQLRTVESLKKNLSAVEAQYRLAQKRRDSIIARERRAKSMERAASVVTKTITPYDPSALNQQLDRMDRRTAEREAKSEAMLEMSSYGYDDQFLALDDPKVLSELESLKASLQARQLPATVASEEDLDTQLFATGQWNEAEIDRELAELKRVV